MAIDYYQNLEGDDLLRQVGSDINVLGLDLVEIKNTLGRIEHRLKKSDKTAEKEGT
jgi:hypothetical protein